MTWIIVRKINYRPVLCFQEKLCQQTRNSASKQSNNEYCFELVRKYDYENFLANLLLPKDIQRAAFAVRAFNVELAQIQDVVSDKRIGQMRMQFYKDSLHEIFKSTAIRKTPVTTELAGACKYYKLSKQWFDRVVEARASHLERDKFLTVKSIEDHAEKINSSLYYLILQCAGIKNLEADHAASHLGKAQGLVTVLRATPYHASRRQMYIPMDTLMQYKVSQEDFIQGKVSQPMKDAVFHVASLANQHLETARSLQKGLPGKSNLIFLNAAVCDNYLKKLQRADFNVFDGKVQIRDHMLSIRMYKNKILRKF